MAEVAQAVADPAQGDRRIERFSRRVDQLLYFGRNGPDADRPGGVRAEPVLEDPEVDSDDVAVLQHLVLAGDPVDDHLVDRGAQHGRGRRLGVAEERALHLVLLDPRARDQLEVPGRRAWLRALTDVVQDRSGNDTRFAHELELLWRLVDDPHDGIAQRGRAATRPRIRGPLVAPPLPPPLKPS